MAWPWATNYFGTGRHLEGVGIGLGPFTANSTRYCRTLDFTIACGDCCRGIDTHSAQFASSIELTTTVKQHLSQTRHLSCSYPTSHCSDSFTWDPKTKPCVAECSNQSWSLVVTSSVMRPIGVGANRRDTAGALVHLDCSPCAAGLT